MWIFLICYFVTLIVAVPIIINLFDAWYIKRHPKPPGPPTPREYWGSDGWA